MARPYPATVTLLVVVMCAFTLARCSSADDGLPAPPTLATAAANDLSPNDTNDTTDNDTTDNDNDIAEGVRRAKAEAAAALATFNKNPTAAFDAYARGTLAAAGVTIEEAAASAAATSSPSTAAARWSPDARGVPPHLAVLGAALAGDEAGIAARAARTKIYRTALNKIAALNSKSTDVAYGVTPFAHLAPSEFRALYLSKPFAQIRKEGGAVEAGGGGGAVEEGGGGRRRRLQQGSFVYGTLTCNKWVNFPYGKVTPPASKDWRNVGGVNYIPRAVRDQAQCGSCAAFAAGVLMDSMWIRKYRSSGYTADNTDLSEQEMLDCLAGDGCQGSLPYRYIDRAICKGVALERDQTYTAVDSGVCHSTAALTRYSLGASGWTEPPATAKGVAQAATQGPVAIAMLANDAFMYYTSGVFNCNAAGTTKSINHATAIVAWNDATPMSNGQTWKVWTVRNSWGTGWGEAGYFKLRKDCSSTGTLNMYSRYYNAMLVA